jgi:ACS family hexuronate transporter-like MFS transporter
MRDPASSRRWNALRWTVVSVFLLAAALNYLDRQLLAAVAPLVKAEFHLTNQDYGLVLLAFSLTYALSSPFVGLFIDRVGLTAGISSAVTAWSLVGALTAFVTGFPGLLAMRASLGVAESAVMPASGKVTGSYLRPREYGIGSGLNQIGLSIGGVLAPLVVGLLARPYGWRSVFLLCGTLGFIWVPVWMFTSRSIPAQAPTAGLKVAPVWEMFRERRFRGLIAANILSATMYTLWTNWVTLYFVEAWGLTQEQANRGYAWIPPLLATLGGLFGGALAYRLIRSGIQVDAARRRVLLIAASGLLLTAAIPLMPTPAWAVTAVSFSYFWATCLAITIYVMPIDFFGPARAAFGVSVLTATYGLLQACVSPLIGRIIDNFGFPAVFVGVSVLPLLAVGILHATREASASLSVPAS